MQKNLKIVNVYAEKRIKSRKENINKFILLTIYNERFFSYFLKSYKYMYLYDFLFLPKEIFLFFLFLIWDFFSVWYDVTHFFSKNNIGKNQKKKFSLFFQILNIKCFSIIFSWWNERNKKKSFIYKKRNFHLERIIYFWFSFWKNKKTQQFFHKIVRFWWKIK